MSTAVPYGTGLASSLDVTLQVTRDPDGAQRPVALLIAPADHAATSLTLVSRTMGWHLVHVAAADEIFDQTPHLQPSMIFVHPALEDIPLTLLIRQLHALVPDAPIVAIARSDQDVAVEAIQAGACRVIDEAASPERLLELLTGLVAETGSMASGTTVRDPDRLHFVQTYASLFRRGVQARELEQAVFRIAEAEGPVLIVGEAGNGKKTVARAIHYLSRRSAHECLFVDCSAPRPTSLEAHLPGPDADPCWETVRGRLEKAGTATLVLENVGDLPAGPQRKLLRLLDTAGPGDQHAGQVDARVIATSPRDIPTLLSAGALQRALAQRLASSTITLPPLRERAQDIPGLAEFFRRRLMHQYQCSTRPLSTATMTALMEYAWPGNVLELENLMRRYVALGDEEHLTRELSDRAGFTRTPGRRRRATGPEQRLREIGRRAANEAELAAILSTLEQVQWNRAEAARRLHVSYKTLLNKLSRAGVPGRLGAARGTTDPA